MNICLNGAKPMDILYSLAMMQAFSKEKSEILKGTFAKLNFKQN